MREITQHDLDTAALALKNFFGKDIVTRQDILASGVRVPVKFFESGFKIGRGVYDLSRIGVPAEIAPAPAPVAHVTVSPVAVADDEEQALVKHQQEVDYMVSHFDRESLIPEANPSYIPWGHHALVKKLLASKKFFTLLVTGDTGTGKNEMIANACSSLGRPLIRVSITNQTREEHLVGSKTLVDGNIKYEVGPVIFACLTGSVLLLDECMCLDSADAMCLQAIMEGGSFFVKSLNRVITPAEGFCIIATDNTKGRGSDSGRFISTNVQNDAFLERFWMTIEQGYPGIAIERKIMTATMKHYNNGVVDESIIESLVNWVSAIRKTHEGGNIDDQITTRRASAIIKTYCLVGDMDKAIELAISRFDEATMDAFKRLWSTMTTETHQPVDVPTEQV